MSGSKSFPPGDSPVSEPPVAGFDQPLGLTVHNLPAPDAQALALTHRTKRSRIKLLLLFLASASPIIASYFTYYVVRPEGRRNYGELIDPQRPLPAMTGVDLAGVAQPLQGLRHQWLLITVADSACDAQCESHLFLSRQLREALGKDKDRLDWVWLRTGDAAVPEPLKVGLQTATVLQVSEAAVGSWLTPAPGQRLSDHLYVVDPMGNWMMRFPTPLDAAKARKDLERLMRASSSWDQPGRP